MDKEKSNDVEERLVKDTKEELIEDVKFAPLMLYASYQRPLYLTSPQMYGEDVKEVQRKLNALGFNCGSPNGYFGPNTQRAVKEFQRSRGLSVDGSCGPATWKALFGSSGSSPNYTRPLYLTSPQMYGEDVKEVQRRLNALGFNCGSPNGYFGPNTQRAVKEFQRSRGLSVDGSCGPATWKALFGSSGGSGSHSKPYTYTLYRKDGLIFHIIETNLSNIETETILKPLANTPYIGINGGFFDTSSYNKPPRSGSSICYNYKDVGKFVTVEGVRRIANYAENQLSDKPVPQRTLVIYKSGGSVRYKIQNMIHVNTALSEFGKSNVLNVIGGVSPNLTSGTAMLGSSRSAISVKGSKAYLIYCPNRISQSTFNKALSSGLGRGLSLNNTVMMDGSGSACMKIPSKFIGAEKRYLYNIIRLINV